MLGLNILFIGPIGPLEATVIFLVFVLIFGADRIPKVARALGESVGELQKGKEQVQEEIDEVDEITETDGEKQDSDNIEKQDNKDLSSDK